MIDTRPALSIPRDTFQASSSIRRLSMDGGVLMFRFARGLRQQIRLCLILEMLVSFGSRNMLGGLRILASGLRNGCREIRRC